MFSNNRKRRDQLRVANNMVVVNGPDIASFKLQLLSLPFYH